MAVITSVALPIFSIMLIGFLAGRTGLMQASASQALNTVVYWFAMPPLLFLAMSAAPLEQIINWNFVAAFLGSTWLVWALAAVIGWALARAHGSVLVMQGMTATFANTGYMGIPLMAAAFGDPGLAAATLATVINAALAVGTAVILLELVGSPGGQRRGLARALGDVVLALARNPLILGAVAGILWGQTGWALPTAFDTLFTLLGGMASPVALFGIGLFLAHQRLTAGLFEVSWVTVLKLVAHPVACWLLIAYLFPLDPFWAFACVLMAALPTGAIAFVIAQNYGVYTQRSSGVILVSTVVSVLTVSVLLALGQDVVAPG